LLFLSAFPRVAPGSDFGHVNQLPPSLVGAVRGLSRIASGKAALMPPVVHHRNRWGGFTFRAFWMEGSAGSGLIGIVVTRQEPVVAKLVRRIGEFSLSPRQSEVCLLLAQGRDHDTIAKALDISRHTAIAHGRWIYNRLDVHNRTELTNRLLS
jgi:DNA-binding CsgD family transcriptional regulator